MYEINYEVAAKNDVDKNYHEKYADLLNNPSGHRTGLRTHLIYGSVYCHSTVAIAERIAIFTKPIRGHRPFSHVEWEG